MIRLALGDRKHGRPLVHPLLEPAAGRSLTDLRILVVDDQEDVLESLAALLEMQGARVVTSLTPHGALGFLATSFIDVVVSDIAMPRMNGLAFMEAARSLGSIPAIAMSGQYGESFEHRAKAAGYFALVQKPVDIDRLTALILGLTGRSGHEQ